MRNLLLVAILLLVTACDHPLPPPPAPLDLSGPVYRVNVASVNVVHDYVSSREFPHVELLADISPATAVKQWVVQRIVAAGQIGSLEVNIKDASILRKDLPKKKHGLEGWFTKEQTEEYDGRLQVEIKLYNPKRVLPVGHIDVVAQLSHTLSEDATAYDREQMYHRMTVELMQEINRQLDANIHQYFANYLL